MVGFLCLQLLRIGRVAVLEELELLHFGGGSSEVGASQFWNLIIQTAPKILAFIPVHVERFVERVVDVGWASIWWHFAEGGL
jgi:hypothetical protein